MLTEGNTAYLAIGNEVCGSSGSVNRACIEDKMMNVGNSLAPQGRGTDLQM